MTSRRRECVSARCGFVVQLVVQQTHNKSQWWSLGFCVACVVHITRELETDLKVTRAKVNIISHWVLSDYEQCCNKYHECSI